MRYRDCTGARGSMRPYTHAPVTRPVRRGGSARSRASEPPRQGGGRTPPGMAWGRAGARPDSPPCPPTPGGPPVASRTGLRPAAARVPAGGAAAAAADRPAQPAGTAPVVPAPGPRRPGQSRGARPRGPGRGELWRQGRCVGVCRWGWGRPRDLPRHGAQSPEDPPVACALHGPGSFSDPGGEGRPYLRRADPGHAIRGPPSAGLRPAAPAAVPVVRPGRKSPVALAAARGPARAAASRRRPSAGTPPSAPAWSARPGPGPPGAAVRPPRLQVRATLAGR